MMSKNPFGWGYPAGAENDPNAPWNEPEMPEECPMCGEPNTDEDGEPLFDDPSFCSKKCYQRFLIEYEDDGQW